MNKVFSPADKAREIFKTHFNFIFNMDNGRYPEQDGLRYQAAIKSAIYHVDEILKYEAMLVEIIGEDSDGYIPNYYKEVRKELDKL